MAAAETNRETELKLAARPEDLDRIRSAPVLAGRSRKRATTRTLESVYWDTPDLQLARRLVTLRVRRQGESFLLTVKTAPVSENGLSRAEWEWPIQGPEPDLSAIVDAEALAQIGPVTADDLKPVFTSVVKRTTRVVDGTDAPLSQPATIEVALDTGEIRTGDGAVVPISEVELELKEGSPGALYDLALELAKVAPLRVEPRTKAERGYALAAGQATDGAVKAEKLVLEPGISVEGALARILRSCLAHLTANEACALKGEDQEGVHQMRVALRRMRSALALFRPFLPREQYDWMVGEVRWLAGSMGAARDWDVFLAELLEPVEEGVARTNGQGAPLLDDLKVLRASAESSRDHAYAGVRDAVLSARYTEFQLRLGGWLEARGWRAQPVSEHSVRLFHPMVDVADQLLAKRHKKARRAGAGFAHLSVAERHQLRIALKKLRYAAEFFRSLYDEKPVRRYVQQVAAMQEVLGHLNDVATATRLLSALHDGGGPVEPREARAAGIVMGWHARGVNDREDTLVGQWEDFAAAKPFWSKPEEKV